MIKVTTHQAKTHLSQLLGKVAEGEKVMILRGTAPAAYLVPAEKARKTKRPPIGTLKDPAVTWTKDAFAPLSDDELKDWGLK